MKIIKIQFRKSISLSILTFAFSILIFQVNAQQLFVNTEWESTSGSLGKYQRTASALDGQGNLIVVSNVLNSTNTTDVSITKKDPNGIVLWQTTFNGNGNGDDYGVEVKINGNDEIFIAASITTSLGVDFGVIKYSSAGILTWSNTWNGPANKVDFPTDLALDGNNNVYVVGNTQATNSLSDYGIVKFTNTGTLAWANTYDYANLHDGAAAVYADVNNVLVTGASASSLSNWDYATLDINASTGVIQSTDRTVIAGVGLDNAFDITTDGTNTYITGYTENSGNRDIQTVKLDGNLNVVWVKNYDGGLEDVAVSIQVDNAAYVYITGYSEKTNGGYDFITIKYDDLGNEIWTKEFGSEGGIYTAKAVQLRLTDDDGIVIVGNKLKNGFNDFVTIKYDNNGNLLLVKEFDYNNGEDRAESVVVDGDDIYVSGISIDNGQTLNSTLKYSLKERIIVIVQDANGSDYVKQQLTIRFDKSSIIYSAIDEIEFEAGTLDQFVTSSVIQEMDQKTSFSWGQLNTFKIFRRLTTTDNVSISRLGQNVNIPDFWATLTVEIPAEQNTESVAALLNDLKGLIQYAERDYTGELLASIPNDNLYPTQQSGLNNVTHGIDIVNAWDKQVGRSNVKVGVFDSGINWQHEDFGNGTSSGTKVAGGWDFQNNIGIFYPSHDPSGHGSSCGGIIGALRNNNKGVAGIAGGNIQNGNTGAQLISMKINNGSSFVTHSVIANAIVEGAIKTSSGKGYGLHVQNHSWASKSNSLSLKKAAQTCHANSCVFVSASGNYPASVCGSISCELYPASLNDNWVIKVGANDNTGKAASFSVQGKFIDVIAPGTKDIYASVDHNNNSGYSYNHDGTSFAAPHVSGVAALLCSEHNPVTNAAYPNVLSPEDVENFLQSTATDVIPSGYDNASGHGRINAKLALEKVTLPYRVRHFQQSISTSTATLHSSNQTITFPEGIDGLANGQYIGKSDIYKLSVSLSHTLLSTENYLSGWVRNSSCDLFENTNALSRPHWAGVALTNSNQTSANLEGYIYKVRINNILGQQIGVKWFPVNLSSTVRFAYSIHTKDDNPNVGFENYSFENDFVMFPNPAENQLHIRYRLNQEESVHLIIMDITGKPILSIDYGINPKGVNSQMMDISKLSAGLYICHLNIGNQTIVKRLIKN